MPSLVSQKEGRDDQAVTFRLWVDGRIESIPTYLFALGPQSSSLSAPEDSAKHKIPNLEPTRQETMLYFQNSKAESRKKASQLNQNETRDFHLPVSIASYPTHPPKTAPSCFPLDLTSGDGMNVQKGVAKSYDSSILRVVVANRNIPKTMSRTQLAPNGRDFAEIANDLNCRRVKTSERVMKPSKYGFHPRSYSPTFKCLVEASEKLNILVGESSKSAHDVISDLTSVESSAHVQDGSVDERCAITSQYGASESDYTESVSTIYYNSSLDIPAAVKQNGTADLRTYDSTSEIHLFLPHLPDESKRKYKKEFVPKRHVNDACTTMDNSTFPVINGSVNSGSANNGSVNSGTMGISHTARCEVPRRKRTQNRRSLSPPKQRGKEKLVRMKTFDLHEPYLKSEMLKETLDDFPTLVSQRSPD
ncbi:uncharacterized protein LOC121372134 [Gigantopelta aegis]|uniref:uncharacterized protein LOC121372134 n=1 Tax=Gigantopelta aegis TaxID=1735272 RepID=UPI001B88AD47|nr:uncharacterized protein LOC121372134 [Gigantopelta aegis]